MYVLERTLGGGCLWQRGGRGILEAEKPVRGLTLGGEGGGS